MDKQQVKALFTNDISMRKAAIRSYVMDEANAYEDRLEVWKATPDILQHKEQWMWCHPTMLESEWLGDTPSRHEQVWLTDIPDRQGWDPVEDSNTIRSFYMGCMASGIWEFTYDW